MTVLGILVLCLSVDVSSAPAAGGNVRSYDRIESALCRYLDVLERDGAAAAAKYAEANAITIHDGRLLCSLTLYPGFYTTDLPLSTFSQYGVMIDSRSRNFIEVWIPSGRLVEFAKALEQVILIQRPQRAMNMVQTEGLGLFGAAEFHNEGIRGAGVHIGVFDGGYADYEDLHQRNEFPAFTAVNYVQEGMNEGTIHGAACVEVLYDLAPQAEFTLFKMWNSSHFERAVEYALAHQLDVISMSIGWHIPIGDYYHGDDRLSQIVNDAFEQGLFLVESAGNSAQAHYRATFNDNNAQDHYHRFANNATVNPIGEAPDDYTTLRAGEQISVSLVWDDFPATDQDFDLELVRVNGNNVSIAAVSNAVQNGNDNPTEEIIFVIQVRGDYGVRVLRSDADNGMNFTLITYPHGLGVHTSAGSITVPSLAENCFTVGAVEYRDWDDEDPPIEWFSSRGPTYDGRIKPDIVAPDGVSTVTYGVRAFFGTSCACPHLSGAAALVLSNQPLMDAAGLRDYLIENAIDIGDNGQDNTFGYGKVHIEPVEVNPNDHPAIVIDTEELESEDGGSYEVLLGNEGRAHLTWAVSVRYQQGQNWLTCEPSSGVLRPGRQRQLLVTLNAARLNQGDYHADLIIASNDPDNNSLRIPVTLRVLGEPLPRVELSDSVLDFQRVDLGSTAQLDLIVFNTGRSQLTVFDVLVEGAGYSTDFNLLRIEPGQQRTIVVSFAPREPGVQAGRLTISTTDPVNDPVYVDLTGVGVNSPPQVVNPIADVSLVEDCGPTAVADLDDVFSDPNNDRLFYAVTCNENLRAEVLEGNVLIIHPAPDFFGANLLVSVTADDRHRGGGRMSNPVLWLWLNQTTDREDPHRLDIVTTEFYVTVTPVNDPPMVPSLTSPADGTSLPDQTAPLRFVWAEARDVEGDPIGYSWYLAAAFRETDTVAVVSGLYAPEYSIEDFSDFLLGLGIYNPYAGRRVDLYWWVGASDGMDSSVTSERWRLNAPVPVAVPADALTLPREYSLLPIYPNPFNSSARIGFTMPASGSVSLTVLDVFGKKAAGWEFADLAPGAHELVWNAEDVPPGLYFVRLEAPCGRIIRKLTLVK